MSAQLKNAARDSFMTVVVRLPDSLASCRSIADALGVGKIFHGGEITAVSLEDEITVNERLEEHLPPGFVERLRCEVASGIG